MHIDEVPRRRAQNRDVADQRKSAASVKPFLGNISVWQTRCAFLRVAMDRSEEGERAAVLEELTAMRNELRAAIEKLQTVAGDGRPVRAVHDVLQALRRLDDHIGDMLGRAEGPSH